MRDETHDQTHHVERRRAGTGGERRVTRPTGATVSIPPRATGAAFTATTLQARLALLRPQPLRLRPAGGNER